MLLRSLSRAVEQEHRLHAVWQCPCARTPALGVRKAASFWPRDVGDPCERVGALQASVCLALAVWLMFNASRVLLGQVMRWCVLFVVCKLNIRKNHDEQFRNRSYQIIFFP